MARPQPTLFGFLLLISTALISTALIFTVSPVLAQASTGAGLVLLDRIVAVVDDDPIFFSDLLRARALGDQREMEPRSNEEGGHETRPYEGKEGSTTDDLRPWLSELVQERLRAHDIDRYGVPPASPAAIDAQLAKLEESRGGAAALDAELATLGARREDLRRRIGLQLRILTYIDERLAPRVFVDDTEVFTYFENELRSRLLAAGQETPPLDQVQNEIRLVLREQKLNREADEWTESLSRRARLIDLLERPATNELPPVVLRLEEKKPPRPPVPAGNEPKKQDP